MKLIARTKIIGAISDEDLRALDGIRTFEANTSNENQLIELFLDANPGFRADSYEIVEDK